MATLREANLARKEYSRALFDLGAHAFAVDEVSRKGTKTFAVIAYFEDKPPRALPRNLEVTAGKRKVKVPLVVKVMEKYRLE
jgi:hypothetical protein